MPATNNLTGKVIIAWNDIYLELVRKLGGAPGPLARIGGLMHWAMYETIKGIGGTAIQYPSALPGGTPTPPTGIKPATLDPEQAAAHAAAYALKELVDEYVRETQTPPGGVPNPYGPFQTRPVADQQIQQVISAATPNTTSVAAGPTPEQDYGQHIAQAVLKAQDAVKAGGFDPIPKPKLIGGISGEWRPTGSGEALTPNWGRLPLLLVESVTQYPSDIIPQALRNYDALLKSELYAMQVAEVAVLGGAQSAARTEEQTEIAFFWANDLNGTSKPPGQLYTITQQVARHTMWPATASRPVADDLVETARLFAMVGTAMTNAGIIAWYAKYFWPGGPDTAEQKELLRLWRPETAIQRAAEDNNPSISADPTWQPLSATREGMRFSPNFPAFVSGHSTFGAAHAAAMRTFFQRDDVAFTATTEDPHALRDANGVRRTRHFTSFTQAALENGRSRVYLGVHYQFDAQGGYKIGTAVGNDTAAKFMLANAAASACQ